MLGKKNRIAEHQVAKELQSELRALGADKFPVLSNRQVRVVIRLLHRSLARHMDKGHEVTFREWGTYLMREFEGKVRRGPDGELVSGTPVFAPAWRPVKKLRRALTRLKGP